ncbi:MarR family winged helix-turn-helix transcriptional regulator [Anianabacter salinae]|uniref:MarR family winged helix-turn-helix transcriptional regulator n=1 Tax=Anianabacter salinae TaxID=2851023 RepID=UPI00225DD667|nr:MarR family transcriptional regulator [Anianabacter salinae]MBV0911933.1 MarR family transcriptional regulator [Anianabacter salinae]
MADGAKTPDAPVDLGALGESLGFLLRLAQLRAFEGFFEAMGDHDVRPGEVSVLMLIARNPGLRQGVLARHLSIKRAHMAKMVAQMERSGWIDRRVPDDDRRAVELSLTEAGRKYLSQVQPAFDTHEADAARPLSPQDEATLKRLLKRYLSLPNGKDPT